MSKSVVIKQNQGFLATLPIGSIIGWHRDLNPDYIPLLPAGWVECNGQTIDDPESPFHGLQIPNLNGEGRFLRGAETSGELQEDQMQSHKHDDLGHDHDAKRFGEMQNRAMNDGPYTLADWYKGEPLKASAQLTNPVESTAGPVRHGDETRPINMSVIWIMKVKHVASTKAIPAVQAEPNAPLGAMYVNRAGNVGIGTAEPGAKLDVNGDIQLQDGVAINEISDDAALSDDSNSAIPTEKAVKGYVDNRLPAGMIAAWATETPPGGWLECNGAEVSRTAYSKLFSAIGTKYGSRDGSTTFNLPDFRSEFLRGSPDGGSVGTRQGYDWKSFYSKSEGRYDYTHGPAYAHKDIYPKFISPGYWIFAGYLHTPANVLGFAWDGSEIRPRNIWVMFIINY